MINTPSPCKECKLSQLDRRGHKARGKGEDCQGGGGRKGGSEGHGHGHGFLRALVTSVVRK